MSERLTHDALVKSILTDPTAAQEFISRYLPERCKELLDLTTLRIEKESYIEEDLRKNLSI